MCFEYHQLAGRRVCVTHLADTLAFFYTDTGGRAVAVARYWFVERGNVRGVTDSIRSALAQVYGPGERCPRTAQFVQSHAWEAEWRWAVGEGQVTLWAAEPRPPSRQVPFVQIHHTMVRLDCGVRYAQPQPRIRM